MFVQLIDQFNQNVLFPWRRDKVVSELAPFLKSGDTVLDFGCGYGDVAHELAVRTETKVVGIEITTYGRKASIPRILYDGTHLPLKDNSFDGAVMVDMLHHTRDVKETLRKVARTARRFLLIKDMKYRTRLGFEILKFADLWTNGPDPSAYIPNNFLTWKQWKDIFDELDLSISYYKPLFRLIPFDPIQYLNFIVLLEKKPPSGDGRAMSPKEH